MVESCWKYLLRLANGIDNRVWAINTIEFIKKEEVPAGCTVTYANFVCDYRTPKTKLYRFRLTVVGNRLEYPDDASLPAAFLLE